MQLVSLLSPAAVFPHLPALSKKQALKQLAAHAAGTTGLGEKEIYATLMDREQMGCTAMGGGVCVPHGRFELLSRSYVFFATFASPIEFGAQDGRPVDLLFLLLTPADANSEHIKALALVSRLLRDKALAEKLRTTYDSAALYHLLTREREDA